MRDNFRRVIAALSLAAFGSVVAAAPATAADPPTGVSNAGGGLSIVSLDYGNILKATLVGESNSDTIDPANGVPTAKQILAALTLKSATLPALDALSVAPVQTTSTGAEDQKSTALLDLSTLGAPGVTGSINPATLSSLVDANGAKSTLTSTLANISTLGVLGVHSASVTLGGLAGPTSATATRAVTADAITILDLQALLNLVGLSVTDLPLSTITGLLDQLGEIPLLGDPSLTDLAAVNNAITAANTAVDNAQAAVNTAVGNLAIQQAALAACLGNPGCIAIVQPLLDAAQAALDTANATLDAAQAALASLVQSVIDVVSGTPLVAVDGITAGAAAKAADTAANSSATVTAAINDIRLGGLDLGGIDANSTLDQIQALATQLTTTITDALGTISPQLANLISIKLFQRTTKIFEQDGYQYAFAAITALSVTITPPDICALLGDLGAPATLPTGVLPPATPVNDVLNQLDSTVDVTGCLPLAPASVTAQIAPVNGLVGALTGPMTLDAATVRSGANFKVVAAPATPTSPTSPALPRTGINEALLLIVGGLMAAAALGVRRVTAPVRATNRQR